MSRTTTELDQGKASAGTVRLPNGQILTVNSNISIEADEIPVIDVSGIYSESIEDRKAVAEKVRELEKLHGRTATIVDADGKPVDRTRFGWD